MYVITYIQFVIVCCLFVFVVVRAHVPRMTLDELFEQKGDVAQTVLEELEKVDSLFCIDISDQHY